jgi:hypothetical protein
MATSKESAPLGELYNSDYFNGFEYLNYEQSKSVFRRNFERKLRLLRLVVGMPSLDSWRLLEIGCASGEFLNVARAAGASRHLGVEVSDYARGLAGEKGLNVISPFSPDFEDKIRILRPNVVVAWDVWEHLENPIEVFDRIFAMSDEQVIIAVTTVDAGGLVPRIRGRKWRQFHPPTHLNYPTRTGLKSYFASRGIKTLKMGSFGYYRPLADYVGVFLGKNRAWLARFPLLFKVPFYLNCFDIQLYVGQREIKR